MEMILKKLANLIDVKTIVTFLILAVYATLALTGKIEPEGVSNITLMVVAFYFGTQHQKKVAETAEAVKGNEAAEA